MRFPLLSPERGDDGAVTVTAPEQPLQQCPVCGPKAAADLRLAQAVSADYILPEEMKSKLDYGRPPVLVDLRCQWEHDLAHISGNMWADHEAVLKGEAVLRPGDEIVLYCKGQSKSTAAWRALKAKGFAKVRVLKGGIDAWVEKIDRTRPRY
jgi:rhodanese-related sulfurtransferase